MSTFTKVKVGLAIIGITLFFAGVRLDDTRLRYIAIGFVAVAWIMRFVKTKPERNGTPAGD
ncbi:MAG: hypothetical protein ABIZ91_10725 [Gemmatimonadaceae bacterium]